MRDILFNPLGFYNAAFFRMHVQTTEDLQNFSSISLQTEATYFHEYIHFLQDITTTYGLMNICAIADYIKLVSNKAIISGVPSFNVPFALQLDTDNNVRANWELKSLYNGGGQGMNDISTVNSINKAPANLIHSEVDPSRITIDFNDSLGRNHRYSLGAYCIVESMAYTMEQVLYPNILPPASRLPYESVKIACDKLHPGFSHDPLNIIALCDASLMFFHPGEILYDALVTMQQQNYLAPSPEDIYRFVFRLRNGAFNYHGHTTIQQLFLSQSSLAINQLNDYFTTTEFKDNRKWINYILSSAVDLRLTKPGFYLDIVRQGPWLNGGNVNNRLLTGLLTKLGSPIVINSNAEMTFVNPPDTGYDVVPEYLWVISQIYKIYSKALDHSTYRCEMIQWCDQSADEAGVTHFTCDRCRYDPWTKSEDNDPNPCTFGRMWKTWGLQNIYPQ